MPAPFGVTAAGFNRPSQLELIALIEQDQHAEIDPLLDVSTDGVLGQLNGIYSRPLDQLWQVLETIFHGFDPDAAQDFLLTFLAKLTGTDRRAAASSECKCTITADEGTVIEAGVNFAAVAGRPDDRFTPRETFTAAGAGPYTEIVFRSERVEQVNAVSGDLTVIATPVSGWIGIVNTSDAADGRDADDDPTLRTRREAQLTSAGSSTLEAIRSDLSKVDGVLQVTMFENVSDNYSTTNGLPPHSYEAVIWDGLLEDADEDAIAQVLWNNNARAFGSLSGTATDKLGNPQVMRFSRSTAKLVYLDIDVTPRDGYVGDSDFAQAVAEACNDLFGIGDDVDAYDISLATKGLGAKVPTIRLGFSASPSGTTDLAVGLREVARFDTGRITINHV